MQDQIFQTARDFWAIIAAFGGFMAWLFRLEARAKSNTKDIVRLDRDVDRQRSDMQDMLKEIRDDIKTLMQRH